jgi:hypothetical protein
VLLPALAAAASPPAGPPTARPAQWEKYRVLSERNIFLRNRAKPPSSRFAPSAAAAAAARSGHDRVVLTGIIQQGGDYVAFLEDTRTGKTSMVQVGDPVAAGRLAAITLDAVEYACDGNTTRIPIGCNLTGTVASLPKPATAASATAAPAPTPAAATQATATSAAAGAPALTPAAAAPETATSAAAGATPATASMTPPQTAPPQTSVGTSDGATDRGTASTLERMRQRRERELNK